jgi:acetolactate synthase-1/2/3 large subunit
MEESRVSELIAEFLEDNKIDTVFGIIGAGNAHIFDAITRRGYTEIVCVHHEQAAVMAMGAYYRTSGKISATIVTTGAGTTNTITGLVSNWMDSVPGFIICGNEKSIFCKPEENPLRIWGVQGYDSIDMVKKVSKYSKRVTEPTEIIAELTKAKEISLDRRMGPTWLEIPMDIQAMSVKRDELKKYNHTPSPKFHKTQDVSSLKEGVERVVNKLKTAKRPVLWLGNGIRLADALDVVEPLVEKVGAPSLVTWQGIDLIDSSHPLVFGRAGVYGQRYSNFVLQNSDLVISIGTRMAIPQIGYSLTELAREAEIIAVDIDTDEIVKHKERLDFGICADAKDFMEMLLDKCEKTDYSQWVDQCNLYKERFPIVGPEHEDKGGYINSYPFMKAISDSLKDDDIVITDMGTALLSGFQIMELDKKKRMFTSTGLGEMGYGLPAAMGASFARDKGEVICLNCDGGMMMNLQELQTIAHHKLPIKILVFNNDGYLMIKNTQKGLFKGRFSGTNKNTGVSCPDFSKLADAFGFKNYQVKTWEDSNKYLKEFIDYKGTAILEVFTHPEQLCVPKLGIALTEAGEIVSPPLEDLSPILDRDTLRENMIIGMHPKSEML